MARTHLIEVAFPTDPSKRESLVDGHRFGRERLQGEVNRLTLGGELITAHHLGVGPVVDV